MKYIKLKVVPREKLNKSQEEACHCGRQEKMNTGKSLSMSRRGTRVFPFLGV